MNKIILLLITSFGISSLMAQNNPTYEWMSNVVHGDQTQYITAFDSDDQGNLYCGGLISGATGTTTTFNNGDSFLSPGFLDGQGGFLAKTDSNGVTQWTKDFPQTSGDGVRKVVVSPSQELFVASYTDQPATLDGVSIPTRAIYLFRYDLNGILQSHVEFEVVDTYYNVDNLAVDENNNAYISGFFNGTITFGTTTISSSNGGIFHVKIDVDGNVMWIQQFNGRTWDLKIAHDGHVLIAGNCPSSATFGSFTAGSTNFQLPFIVKLDAADGTPLFLHTPESNNGGEARTIVQDVEGNIYLGGFFGKDFGPLSNSILDFGDFTIDPIGGNKTTGLVAKYSADGTPIWAKTMGGSGNGHAQDMVIHNNIITVRGEMAAKCLYPNVNDSISIHTFTNSSYFATINTAGLWIDARATSFPQGQVKFEFLQTNTGSLYFAGKFAESYVYNDGQDSIVSLGGDDTVIAKINDISTVITSAPTNLQVTGYGSNVWNATTSLSWTDNANDEFGYFLYAKDQNGSTVGPKKLPENTISGSVDFLWDGVTYDFAVHSHKFDMLSEPSNIVTDVAQFSTGIDEYNLNNTHLSLYPNPFYGELNIQADKEIQIIEVYNLLGKRVLIKSINALQTQIDLEHLAKGMYIVNTFFEEGVITHKVILE